MSTLRAMSVSLAIIVGVAIVWLTLFNFNVWLFSHAAYNERAHWIFLPAAVRVLAVLLFGGRGAAGLIVGAYLTLPHQENDDLTYESLLAISSGLAPLIAVAACQKVLSIKRDLAGLRGSHIAALSIASAVANAGLLNILMLAARRHDWGTTLFATIIVGDTIGAAVLLVAIAIGAVVFASSRNFLSNTRRGK